MIRVARSCAAAGTVLSTLRMSRRPSSRDSGLGARGSESGVRDSVSRMRFPVRTWTAVIVSKQILRCAQDDTLTVAVILSEAHRSEESAVWLRLSCVVLRGSDSRLLAYGSCPRMPSTLSHTFNFFTWSAIYSDVRHASAMMESVGFLSALLTKGAPSATNKFLQSHAWQ